MRLVSCALVVVSTLQAVSAVPTFGRAGHLLRASDVTTIRRLARSNLHAVEVLRAQVLPESWLAFAYLKPESDSRGVRLGRLVELESVVRDGLAQRWRVTNRRGRYAQVALSASKFSDRFTSATLDRPFTATGAFSADDILEVVTFRSGPRRPPIPDDPDGTSHAETPDRLNGRLPIIQIARVDAATIEVWLADDQYSGEHAVLHYQDGGWRLGAVSLFIV